MKNILVLAIVFATLSSNATENASFTTKEDGKTTLFLDNVLQGDQLLVKDEFGIILYRESIIKSGQYNKSFDLTALPDGDYVFELDKKIQIRVYPFSVASSKVKFEKESLKIYYKPTITVEKNNVKVRAYNPEKTAFSIEIYYNVSGDTFEKIYSETLTESASIFKNFKLLENEKEDYKLVITTNGKTFASIINFK